ncbi:MAG: hypothetical protein R3199_02915 [Gemmatimonadota bacterium]|nr:hypothetical protein [Gemmatimonadota bacterium]
MIPRRASRIVAVAVFVLGLAIAALSTYGWTEREGSAEIGPVAVEFSESRTLDVPPWLGFAIAAAGAVYFVLATRR